MNIELSIIIPSLRPKVLEESIKRIYDTTNNLDYEIIVVTSLEMSNISKLDRVKIVKETREEGSNKAIELGKDNAIGKYIMELSDDHLVDTGCLKNIVDLMEFYNNDLFLCGPRFHDLWEIHPENTVYGFYYPKTPCIKKSNLDKLGSFYDTTFHSYFGDPDLALRVISNRGIVSICPTAWIEQHNIKNDNVVNNRRNYFDRDSNLFLGRWKPIYGKKVSNPDKPNIVNLGGIQMFKDGALPNEYCSRIFHYIKTEDWNKLDAEINSQYICSQYLLPDLYAFILVYSNFIPDTLFFKLKKTLIEKLSKKKHEFNIVDFEYMLTGLRDNNKVIRLFNDLRKYRSLNKHYVEQKAHETLRIINECNSKISS